MDWTETLKKSEVDKLGPWTMGQLDEFQIQVSLEWIGNMTGR